MKNKHEVGPEVQTGSNRGSTLVHLEVDGPEALTIFNGTTNISCIHC